jgi:glycerol-3-phosphate dehydrogenase
MHDRAIWTLTKLNRSKKEGTASLARGHVVEISDSGLVSLMGGKWTAYRKMGMETVDQMIKASKQKLDVKYEESQTLKF